MEEHPADSSSALSVTLRPLHLSDSAALLTWASDPAVARFCRWEPYTSEDEAVRFITNTVLPHPYFRAICVDGRPVGSICVTRNVAEGDRCRGELGYAIGSAHWGKGITTAAVRLAVAEVFEERRAEGLERVEALVDAANVASQRVLEKSGFQREGVLRKYCRLKGRTRDVVMFSLLRSDSDGDGDGDR